MKKTFILAVALMASLFTCKGQDRRAEAPEFKMHIRLWQPHHNNPELGAQLLEALKAYPGFCDEVWFETESRTSSLEEHEASARRMGVMAAKMRELGVTPSIQAVILGHPEVGPGDGCPDGMWRVMVGPDGSKARTQYCPRCKEYLEYMEAAYECYARECRPYGIWLDDDLRVTGHDPVSELCYCDECLRTFNEEHDHHYTRESLVADLDNNVGNVRREWIRFTQESLAGLAAAVSRGVHKGCPETHMGLQHVNFHNSFLEGYDWNPIFDAMERETGLAPLSRPGNGFYKDHNPRDIFTKGLDIARQIRRLNADIIEIAPEIEGAPHKATGKSPHGACLETMYYLSMGATQMSYALISAANEPMQWYADNYFKALQHLHGYAKEYVDFNWGTQPGGLNPYISRNLPYSSTNPGNGTRAWRSSWTGSHIYGFAALGIPFCPDGQFPCALFIDHSGMRGMEDEEILALRREYDLVVNTVAWEVMEGRGLVKGLAKVGEIGENVCYESPDGRRVAVIDLKIDITTIQRRDRLAAMDWASHNTMPAIIESFAQAALIPRVDADRRLRSVAIMNCSISEQESYTLRLRTGDAKCGRGSRYIWKVNGKKDVRLKPKYDGNDVILTVPALGGWQFGWIAIK